MIAQLAPAVALCLALAGCASTVTGHGSGSGTPKPTGFPSDPRPSSSQAPAAGTFVEPAAGDWQQQTDSVTGIRFDLPGHASAHTQTVRTRDGASVQERLYQVLMGPSDGGGVSIGILGKPGQRLVIDLDTYPQQFRDEFRQAGSKDAAVTEIHDVQVDGHDAIDFRISFTVTNGTGKKAVWLMRVIDDDHVYIVAQTIDFDATPTAVLPAVRATQARLVSGIRPA